MATQNNFYGPHTEKKLQAIGAYLQSFLTVLSKQNFETIYIDAFAGSGTLPIELGGELLDGIEDAKTIIEGSALRAIALERQFSRYVFIEKDSRKLAGLKELITTKSRNSRNMDFICGDANAEIAKLCPLLNKANVRSVVFLDPTGNHVGWSTLDALAATEHVDLWYLFPAGLGVNRQISNVDAKMTTEQKASLDRLFGPNEWQDKFIRKAVQKDLFGEIETTSKVASIDDITRYKIDCMKTIFKGEVLDKWLPLGRDGAHWYSLIFAMANPSKKAKVIGHDLARHIMTNS